MADSSPLHRKSWRNVLLLIVGVSALGLQAPTPPAREARLAAEETASLPAAEFSRLIQNLSEEDGYFRSDNFTSNETSYLHVVDLLRELHVSGGAYVGVGLRHQRDAAPAASERDDRRAQRKEGSGGANHRPDHVRARA